MTESQTVKFVSCVAGPEDAQAPALWFIFQGDKLLVQPAGVVVSAQPNGRRAHVPLMSDISPLGLTVTRRIYLGYLRGADAAPTPCYAAEIAGDAAVPEGLAADGLRQLYGQLDETQFSLAGRAIQIVAWDRTHQFCGQCGGPTEAIPTERAKRCPRCELTSYPRLSPAIIIAVVRATAGGPRLLLARNHRFPAGRYSVVAGFVEPGETLEECASREVGEEVGIQIKNVRYFGSQPWPFPNSLMIGFTAEYAGGEFDLEASEIADAGWFAADALPGLPPKMSIARRLIDWFADGGAAA
jgi:NAD+ diphosphatase